MDRRFHHRDAQQRVTHATPTSIGREALCAAGLAFPLIAKPDVGRHGIYRSPTSRSCASISGISGGRKLMLQRFVPHAGRAAVLYARLPGAPRGRLLSLTLRADGRCRDGRRHITPALEARLDAVAAACAIPLWPLELRFASIDALERGEDFAIVDVCGVGGVLERAWNPPCRSLKSIAA
jgi:hypothetical protein